jgi:hypothetical protein
VKVARQENSRVIHKQIDPACLRDSYFGQLFAQCLVGHVPVHQNAAFGRFEHSSLRDVSCRGNEVIAVLQQRFGDT